MHYSPILFSQIADLNLTQFHNCKINMDYLNSKDKIVVFKEIRTENIKTLSVDEYNAIEIGE